MAVTPSRPVAWTGDGEKHVLDVQAAPPSPNWPALSSPKLHTVPSDFKPTTWIPGPPANATKPTSSGRRCGAGGWPPQAQVWPLRVIAKLPNSVTATDRTAG